MNTSPTPTTTWLQPPCSSSGTSSLIIPGTFKPGGSWGCWISTTGSKKSSDWPRQCSVLLHRRQWLLRHLPSGQYLQAVQGRQTLWTQQPDQACHWMTPDRVVAIVKADPDLFGNISEMELVEQDFTADPTAAHLWHCNA